MESNLDRNGRLVESRREPCNGGTDPSQEDTDQGGHNDLQECDNDSTNPLDLMTIVMILMKMEFLTT